jgi:uncharacterized membrane protein
MNAIAIAFHLIAAVVWVGGMFFAYVVLRPSANMLEPPRKLSLWAGVFKRFFPWVWAAAIILLFTGYWLMFRWFNGFGSSPGYVHIMHLLGLVMIVLFIYLYYRPYRTFTAAVQLEKWPDAADALNRIRHIVLMNLILGLVLMTTVSGLQKLG